MKLLKKLIIILIKQLDLGSAVAVRLTKLTGKSKVPIHPKHFVTQEPWFTKYLDENDIVLDLGAGNGQNAIKAAKFCKKVIAVEIDQDLVKIAKTQIAQKRIRNIIFKFMNLEEKMQFKDNSFDKVLFLDVLEHLRNRDQIMTEIRRVLKPRGLLLLGVPNSQTSWKKFQRAAGVCSFSDPDHKIEFSQTTIQNILDKYKFIIVEFNFGKFDIPFRGIVDILGAFSITFYKKVIEWRTKKTNEYPQEAAGFEIAAQNIK